MSARWHPIYTSLEKYELVFCLCAGNPFDSVGLRPVILGGYCDPYGWITSLSPRHLRGDDMGDCYAA